MTDKKGCYKCGDSGHQNRDCLVASRRGRKMAREVVLAGLLLYMASVVRVSKESS